MTRNVGRSFIIPKHYRSLCRKFKLINEQGLLGKLEQLHHVDTKENLSKIKMN